MTMLVQPNAYLATPVPKALIGTLLDAATVSEGLGWMDTEAISLSFNCITTNNAAVWPCPANMLAAPVQSAASTAV